MIDVAQARAALAARTVPPALSSARGTIARRYQTFLAYAESLPFGQAIYGTTTLPGHRDHEPVPKGQQTRFQHALVDSHAIGSSPFLPASAIPAITLAKACSLVMEPAAPISEALFLHILLAFEDTSFAPLVPSDASYGAGDVIPAAHWAKALLAHPGAPAALKPGEGMALINGAFVHVGATLAVLDRLEQLWHRTLDALAHDMAMIRPDPDSLMPLPAMHPSAVAAMNALAAAAQHAGPGPGHSQQPVALRTIPQLLDGFANTATQLVRRLGEALSRPSGNPLFSAGPPPAHTVSGSFLEPGLTLATSAMVDAVLMVGWAAQRRLTHLLDSHRSGSSAADPVGLIQWPKLAEARLQTARRLSGIRAFAGGDSTSQGIEDFWAFGLDTLAALDSALAMAEDLTSLERAAAQRLAENAGAPAVLPKHPGLPDARAFADATLIGAASSRLPLF